MPSVEPRKMEYRGSWTEHEPLHRFRRISGRPAHQHLYLGWVEQAKILPPRRSYRLQITCAGLDNTGVNLAVELQNIYDSEINIRIGWLWDGGIEVRLGDEMNGFLAEENVAQSAHRSYALTVAHLTRHRRACLSLSSLSVFTAATAWKSGRQKFSSEGRKLGISGVPGIQNVDHLPAHAAALDGKSGPGFKPRTRIHASSVRDSAGDNRACPDTEPFPRWTKRRCALRSQSLNLS
jgi:hypothetical protein